MRPLTRGTEEPPGSGIFFPDELMGNVAKLNIANAFWRVMALAGDIGGGLIVTMPSLKELKNPAVKDYIEEFYSFGSDKPTENTMKVHKHLQNWTAGLHGVGTWHGAGPVMAQKIMIQRIADFEHEKDLVRRTLNLKEKKKKRIESFSQPAAGLAIQSRNESNSDLHLLARVCAGGGR